MHNIENFNNDLVAGESEVAGSSGPPEDTNSYCPPFWLLN